MSGMATGAFPFLDGIVPVRLFETGCVKIVAGFTKLRFLFHQVIFVLRTMGVMADKASVGQWFMLLCTDKGVFFVTLETLITSAFPLQITIIRGVRLMAGKTFSLLNNAVQL